MHLTIQNTDKETQCRQESYHCGGAKAREADTRSLGMILSFFLMTPFMMPLMVLEPEALPLRYLEYIVMACTVLGDDEPVGAFADDAESSKLPSRKLYMS